MSTYTYLAADLLTNTILGELPLTNVKFSQVLNGAGSLSGDLAMSDAKVQQLLPISLTEPGRTAIYVDRDGVLVWGGVIWTRSFSDDGGDKLTIGANEFWSYFRRRLILWPAVFSQVDQLAVVQSLVNSAQARPNGNIGVQVGSETSGVLVDFTAYSYEKREVGQEVENLAGAGTGSTTTSAVALGFDFGIDVSYDSNGNPQKTLRLNYPRRGRAAAYTGHVFSKPGNIVKYEWPEDSTAQATHLFVQGQGDGDLMAQSSAVATELLDAGYPELDVVGTYKDISSAVSLDGHARHDLRRFKYHLTIPKLTVRADADPVLGSYLIGDEARIQIEDSRFPTPSATNLNTDLRLDTYKRIVMTEVTPSEANVPESVDITFGEVID